VLETQNSTAASDNFQVTGQIAAGKRCHRDPC